MKTKSATYSLVTAIARKYAAERGQGTGTKVGADVLIAAVAKALGMDEAAPILAEAGMRNVKGFLDAVPSAEIEDGRALPALAPNDHLILLLRGALKPFREDRMSAAEALQVLLEPQNMTDDTVETLGFSKDATVILVHRKDLFDTRILLRRLAHLYQFRLVLGTQYQGGAKDDEPSDFVAGDQDDAFTKTYRELRRKEIETWEKHLGSPAYARSPLGEVRSTYGDTASHIMGAVLMAEMGYLGGGALHVRELGYILDPKHYHMVLGQVRRCVKALSDDCLLQVLPNFDGEVQLGCQVLPSEVILDSWLTFLDRSALISESEMEEMNQAVV